MHEQAKDVLRFLVQRQALTFRGGRLIAYLNSEGKSGKVAVLRQYFTYLRASKLKSCNKN